MSSHRRRTKYFSRDFNARKALVRGLVSSLVEHGRITTTVDRAKEVRRHVEKAITVGKRGDIATYRLLLSRIPSKPTIESIMKDLSVRFMDRPGGYTRVIKIGRRPGDTAEMAFLEFVDYDFKNPVGAVVGSGKLSAAEVKKTLTAKAKKVSAKLVIAKKKNAKTLQKKARAASRA
jgi:large subunit ribosomal protein L17